MLSVVFQQDMSRLYVQRANIGCKMSASQIPFQYYYIKNIYIRLAKKSGVADCTTSLYNGEFQCVAHYSFWKSPIIDCFATA